MGLDDLANRLAAAGDALAAASATLDRLDLGARVFGGDAPGQLGELGRQLYAGWSGALAAREREAAAHGARLADAGQAVRQASAGYRNADASASDRHAAGDDPGRVA